MRTRSLCGLTLLVLALHAVAWRIAAGGPPRLAPAPTGTMRIALVSVPQRAAPGRGPAPAATTKPVQMPMRPAVPGQAFTPARVAAGARVSPAARPRTHTGDTPRRAPPATRDWPVYPTRPPPSAALRYALVQTGVASAAEGSAELEWQRDAQAFSLRLTTTAGTRAPREWRSTGTFDTAGIAPLQLVERERGRDKRALSFDRDAGRLRFSGAPATPAFARGAQDRWSWIAQLAAIAEAAQRRGTPSDHWDLQVAGLRGDVERWTFRVLPPGDPPPELQGNELSNPRDRAPALLHVLRATEQPYDLRIEAWLSPALHHLPAGLRMSTPPGPWSLSLWQRSS